MNELEFVFAKEKNMKLRSAKIDDIKEYLEIRNSYFVLKYNCMSRLSEIEAMQQLEMDANNQNCFFIDLDGKMIGAIYFSQDEMRYGVKALTASYFLNEKYTGQGYMTQALKMALDIIFSRDIKLVSARVFSENSASINLLKRIGFHQEGYLHYAVRGYNDIIYDDTLWAISKSDLM